MRPDDTQGISIFGNVQYSQNDSISNNFLLESIIDYGDAPDTLPDAVSAAVNLANNGNDIPDYQTTATDAEQAMLLTQTYIWV